TVGLPASPDPTKTESVPPGEMGATDGDDCIGAPALYGQPPPTPVPSRRWGASTSPPRSPTTTDGCPSRLATFGEERATALPASGSDVLHVRLALKPAACATSSAWATGAACTVVVRTRAAAT